MLEAPRAKIDLFLGSESAMGLSTVLLSLAVGASAELADFRVSTPAGSLLYSFDCPSLKGDQFCTMTVRARVSRLPRRPFFWRGPL